MTFYVWDIQTIDGVECLSLVPALSGQSIDQKFDFLGKRLTLEEIEKLMDNYKPQSDIERKLQDRFLTKNKEKLRELAAKEPRSRIVTMAQIQDASKVNDSKEFQEAVYAVGKQKK